MCLAFPLLSSFPFLFRFLLQILKLSGLLIVGLFFFCNTHSERDGGKQGRERITEMLFSSTTCPKRLYVCYYINDNIIYWCKYSLRDLLHATNLISVNREVGKNVTPGMCWCKPAPAQHLVGSTKKIGRLGEVIRVIAWAIEGKDRARPQEIKTEKPHAFSRRLSENWDPLLIQMI